MLELTQSEQATIENQHGDLEAHIYDRVLRSEQKISNIFSGLYTDGITQDQLIVYLSDDALTHVRTDIINAAMNHPHMEIITVSISEDVFVVFQTPGVDNE